MPLMITSAYIHGTTAYSLGTPAGHRHYTTVHALELLMHVHVHAFMHVKSYNSHFPNTQIPYTLHNTGVYTKKSHDS